MDFTEKYTNDSEEKIILRKIYDLLRKSKKTYTVRCSLLLQRLRNLLVRSAFVVVMIMPKEDYAVYVRMNL